MSRPRTNPDKPTWLRVRVKCRRCGGGWHDHLPDGASVEVLEEAIRDIRCPQCDAAEACGDDALADALAEMGCDDLPSPGIAGAA